MKKILILLLLALSTGVAISQNDDTEIPAGYITTSLTSPLLGIPRFTVGYIKPITPKYYIGLEVGYGNKDLSLLFPDEEGAVKDDFKLWEIRPQFYYIFNPAARTKKYISAELFYIDHSDTFSNDIYYSEGIQYRYEQADYSRKKYGLNVNFGMFLHLSKNVGFNFEGGLGLRQRKVSFENIVNPIIIDNSDEDHYNFGFRNYLENEGNEFGLNLNLAIKIFFQTN